MRLKRRASGWGALSVDVALQCFDVLRKGVSSGIGDAADGAGHLAAETLFHVDVSGFGQFVDLHGEIPGRGSGLLAEEDEIGALDPDEDRHDGQPS